jgi:hypothetical protein
VEVDAVTSINKPSWASGVEPGIVDGNTVTAGMKAYCGFAARPSAPRIFDAACPVLPEFVAVVEPAADAFVALSVLI